MIHYQTSRIASQVFGSGLVARSTGVQPHDSQAAGDDQRPKNVIAIPEIVHAAAGPVLSDRESRHWPRVSEILFAEFRQAMVGTCDVGYHLSQGFVALFGAKLTKCYA